MDKFVIFAVVCILAPFSISDASAFKLADNDDLFLRTTFAKEPRKNDDLYLRTKFGDNLNMDESLPVDAIDKSANDDIESVAEEDSQEPTEKICLTKGCVKVAARVIQNMDESVDPCDDFYEFACGGYVKNTFIPPHKHGVNPFSVLEDKVEEKMVMMLEGEPDPAEPKIFESIRNLFKSCMDTEDIEKNSVNELKKMLNQVGGYPVVEGNKWDEDAYNTQDLTLKLRNLGLSGAIFIGIGLTKDFKNSTRRVLEIYEGSAGLGRENMLLGLEDKKVKAHLQHLIDTAKFLGASHEDAEKEMKDVVNLQMELARIHKPQEYWRNYDQWFNLTTLKEVVKTHPDIPWIDLINKYIDNENITVDENEEVVVANPSYLKDLKSILANTSARTKANFQISESIPTHLLNEEAKRIDDKYNRDAYGTQERQPRWKTCLWTSYNFNMATSAMYVKKYFSSNAKRIMAEMIQNIINEFEIILKELDWMDENTRNEALTKARMIRPYVGYPQELLNNTLVDEYYSGIYMAPQRYLTNILNQNIYSQKKSWTKLREPVDKTDWKEHADSNIVNAWYNPLDNSIEFPAGILGGVFFGENRPLYMDYGAVGFVVGHEITHGFDDSGSQFSGHGNMENWWQPETKNKYLERTQCVIDQYGNYSMILQGEEFHFNGVNTQGENIADIGGIKEAYRAYQRLAATFKEQEGTLPGLPYTTNQLMWLAGADIWCSVDRPENIKQQILTDPHAPPKFRVNGPFSNLEEFSKDWNCPIGSNMNPVKKCEVW